MSSNVELDYYFDWRLFRCCQSIAVNTKAHRWPSNQSLPSPGVENVKLVIVNSGGSALPPELCWAQEEKRAQSKMFVTATS